VVVVCVCTVGGYFPSEGNGTPSRKCCVVAVVAGGRVETDLKRSLTEAGCLAPIASEPACLGGSRGTSRRHKSEMTERDKFKTAQNVMSRISSSELTDLPVAKCQTALQNLET
jgi:hypothetical protein